VSTLLTRYRIPDYRYSGSPPSLKNSDERNGARMRRVVRLSMMFVFGVALAVTSPGCQSNESPEVGTLNENLYGLSTSLWTTFPIPVCWDTPGFSTEKGWTQDAVGVWSTVSFQKVSFSGWQDCPTSGTFPGIRITVKDEVAAPGYVGL